MAYSLDYRLRAVECVEKEGKSWDQVLDFFDISRDSLRRWLEEYRETQTLQEFERKRYKAQKVDPDQLQESIKARPDATLEELAHEFGCCFQAIDYRCRTLKITRKKNQPIRGTKRRAKTRISGGD